MSRWFRLPRHSTVVAYTALIAAISGGSAYAATAASVQLGRVNTESTATTLQRSTPGTALALKVGYGNAPLAVNSKKVVANLNSDLLDGQHASAFQPKVGGLRFTPLSLQNGWTTYGSTAPAIARDVNGVTHFRGAMYTTGTNSYAFSLPAGYHAKDYKYLTVDECNATTGRITVYPTGQVYVSGDPHSTFASSAGCFTSLDGVDFSN